MNAEVVVVVPEKNNLFIAWNKAAEVDEDDDGTEGDDVVFDEGTFLCRFNINIAAVGAIIHGRTSKYSSTFQ